VAEKVCVKPKYSIKEKNLYPMRARNRDEVCVCVESYKKHTLDSMQRHNCHVHKIKKILEFIRRHQSLERERRKN
jgi:hypothetical protein